MGSGSISITHVEDVCRAHIFLADKESASGRYICSAVNTCVLDLAKFLSNKYPQYNVPTEYSFRPFYKWTQNFFVALQQRLILLCYILVYICSFGEFPSKAKSVLSSEKLVNEGFKFKYGLEQIYDSTIEYLKSNDLLKD